MRESSVSGEGQTDLPKVSIGLPIYNEGKFIEQTLQSLLSQSYPNFEIIISDNASSDDSQSICEKYMAEDSRIHYHRFHANQGVTLNSTWVLESSHGNYFMWASGHDLWSEHLIEKCVAALEANPDAALAYTSSSWINKIGETMDVESGVYDTRGMKSIGRFYTVFWGNMHPVLGLIRMQYLREIPKIHGCVGSDFLVLAELALKGDFLYIASAQWSRRECRDKETYQEKVARYKSKEFNLVNSSFDRLFPFFRLPYELIRIVLRSRVSILERLSIMLVLLPSFVARYVEGGR